MSDKRTMTGQDKREQLLMALFIQHVLGTLEDEEDVDVTSQAVGMTDWKKRAAIKLAGRTTPAKLRQLYHFALDNLGEAGAEAYVLLQFACPHPKDLVLLQERFVTGQI